MRRALVVALAALLLGGATASAAPTQESTFQDDNNLIFSTPAQSAAVLDTLKQLGVDRIRVSLFWATVAPDAQSRTKPKFDAADPAAYPAGAWDRYDQIVRLASARGMGVNFNVTSPAPLWATGADTPRPDIANTWKPDPAEFAKFVQAVGTRYSGSFRPTVTAASRAAASTPVAGPRADPPLCVLLGNCPPATPAPTGEPLPRVDYFSIWNEPNQAGWLTPQWVAGPQGGMAEASPAIYRSLVDAAYGALGATGHGNDTILVGETAPKGLDRMGPTTAMKSLHFIRQLYCVDDAFHPFTGAAADVRGCPQNAADFPAQHPGLFHATGFAHHPYELYTAPNVKPTDPDFATVANLPTLSKNLAKIFAAYGQGTSGLPLYLTEFGYNTEPPNPAGVTLAQQAAYIDQAEYLTRSNPNVRTLSQFLLVDDAARPGRNGVQAGYGATFQTGLELLGGKKKPAFDAYELALHTTRTIQPRGGSLRVWGMVRPAHLIGKRQTVFVQVKRGKTTHTVRTITVPAATGIFSTRIGFGRPGTLRLAWRDPRSKRVVVSRAVTVRIAKAKAKAKAKKKKA